MNLNSSRPLGDSTTVLDLADRDEMDDDLFPLDTDKSWFTRDANRRYLNFTPCIQEFVPKGSAEFGGRLVFELGSVKACDLLFTVALQIRLGHWFPPSVLEKIACGEYQYADATKAWYYANSLGSAIIAKAEFMLEDQVLETVDGDFSNMFALLYSDINTQFGVGVDGNGRVAIPTLLNWSQERIFPTSNGIISCILPFSFQRIRLRNGFPLTSVKEGAVRVAITLRPFSECVRIHTVPPDPCDGPSVPPGTICPRQNCGDTPLGKSFVFNTLTYDPSGNIVFTPNAATVVASSTVPQFTDCRLVTYGMLVDGKLRQALLHAPFDRMYRDVQTFRFDEPKKYVSTTPSGGIVSLQLPLEVNGPVEEFIWFIRRKAVRVNNEWTNYSNTLEFEYNANGFRTFESMLVSATLQVNGIQMVQGSGDFFRRQISQAHRGGIAAYNNFVYGYSFARYPARQNPSGWMNASRSSDVRLRIEVRPPGGDEDLEFEVCVFALSLNWVRFENGIANRVFSS
jgi:hypothetical protein